MHQRVAGAVHGNSRKLQVVHTLGFAAIPGFDQEGEAGRLPMRLRRVVVWPAAWESHGQNEVRH